MALISNGLIVPGLLCFLSLARYIFEFATCGERWYFRLDQIERWQDLGLAVPCPPGFQSNTTPPITERR